MLLHTIKWPFSYISSKSIQKPLTYLLRDWSSNLLITGYWQIEVTATNPLMTSSKHYKTTSKHIKSKPNLKNLTSELQLFTILELSLFSTLKTMNLRSKNSMTHLNSPLKIKLLLLAKLSVSYNWIENNKQQIYSHKFYNKIQITIKSNHFSVKLKILNKSVDPTIEKLSNWVRKSFDFCWYFWESFRNNKLFFFAK